MLSLSMPAMAQETEVAEIAQEAVENVAIVEVAEVAEVAEEAHVAPVQGSQGRDNAEIDAEFSVGKAIGDFVDQAGFNGFFQGDNWKCAVMLLISFVLLYLAIVKKFEPLLLMPIAFGMLLTNLPGAGMFHADLFAGGHVHWADFAAGSGVGLLDYLYLGVKLGIYPCLIFVGVGAMTDFGPLIANPKSLLLGAAAQIGIFATFLGALALGFNYWESGSIGIIGGADGPTAIYLTSKLAPHLLGPIAVAAYSYMALVPVIQPPIMKLLTTDKERKIEMKQLRTVSQREKIIFPIIITVIIALLLPSAAPLIGSAGVSAVPMAARVSQTVGQQYNPGNFLLMHAMGPNVAGVIGSAVAAGILLAFLPL